MASPQSGILPESRRHGVFLTLLLLPGAAAARRAREACRAVPRLTAELAGRYRDAGLSSVLGIGCAAWPRLFPGVRPRHLHPFVAMQDGPRSAPATPADLLLQIKSDRSDVNFLLAKAALAGFANSVALVEDIPCFLYLDNRDLTGFVDGTENPKGEERAGVALVHDDDPACAGGSYVHIQRYEHRLADWERLPVPEQERVIGRTKADDVELDERAKPPTAHISRVVIEEHGQELEILRHSMPYGDGARAGLYFVAYGRTPHAFETMLRRMFQADPAGHYDHLLRYTRPVTGAAFFAPSLELLAGGGG